MSVSQVAFNRESPDSIFDTFQDIYTTSRRDISTKQSSNSYIKIISSKSYPKMSLYHQNTMEDAIVEIEEALENEYYPEMIQDCSGGVYLCTNMDDENEAIFKPKDEEPFCVNNPKHYISNNIKPNSSMREGIEPGESYLREYAAYILDREDWAHVPPTIIAKMASNTFYSNNQLKNDEVLYKEGSLQLYIYNEGSAEDYGFSRFDCQDVRHIALHDMKIMNLDRHINNLLTKTISYDRKSYSNLHFPRRCYSFSITCSDSSLHLIPIDHGLSIPSIYKLTQPEWCWIHWNQLNEPLTEEEYKYINDLDVEKDIQLLNDSLPIPFEEEYLNTLRCTYQWIKMGATAGLTLNQIASFFISSNSSKSMFMNVIQSILNENNHSIDKDNLLHLLIPHYKQCIQSIQHCE